MILCEALGILYNKENTTPDGHPLSLVEKGAKPVAELFA